MRQNKGAVLLTTVVVLALLATLSQLHISGVLMNEKATFAQLQSYHSQQYAEKGIADALRSIMNCKLNRVSSYRDESGGYEYIIDDYVYEDIYVVTSTGTVLEKYMTTQQVVFKYDTDEFKPNNGWGNGDQDAPGNSLNNNNAENNQNGKEAPKGIQKKREKEKDHGKQCKNVAVEILYWTEL